VLVDSFPRLRFDAIPRSGSFWLSVLDCRDDDCHVICYGHVHKYVC
jgi:hypothetical protein